VRHREDQQTQQDHGQSYRERVQRAHEREADDHEGGRLPGSSRPWDPERSLASDVLERRRAAHTNVERDLRTHAANVDSTSDLGPAREARWEHGTRGATR
jgi:hypothetical protein